jgi:ribose 5-phosphate isomerase B
MKPIAIASDHAGFGLKTRICELLKKREIEVLDLGPADESSVDYPEYGARVARLVSRMEADRGILICGTGIGMSIVANKFPGVRGTLVYDEFTAEMSRRHNDSNILILGARIRPDEDSLKFVEIWLDTAFAGVNKEEKRHQDRLDLISAWEAKIIRDEY